MVAQLADKFVASYGTWRFFGFFIRGGGGGHWGNKYPLHNFPL
jgi:hypothetical protein